MEHLTEHLDSEVMPRRVDGAPAAPAAPVDLKVSTLGLSWQGRLLYQIIRTTVAAYARFMFSIDTRHHTHLPDGPKVFATNHPSATDPFIIAVLVREPISFLTTGIAFRVRLIHWCAREIGLIPVLPGRAREAVAMAGAYLRLGRSVGVAVEGDFSPQEGGLRRPRTGAVTIALQNGVPIIPMGVALARDRLRILSATIQGTVRSGPWYLRGPYACTFGGPIFADGDPRDRPLVRRLTHRLMEEIAALAGESDARLAASPQVSR